MLKLLWLFFFFSPPELHGIDATTSSVHSVPR